MVHGCLFFFGHAVSVISSYAQILHLLVGKEVAREVVFNWPWTIGCFR